MSDYEDEEERYMRFDLLEVERKHADEIYRINVARAENRLMERYNELFWSWRTQPLVT